MTEDKVNIGLTNEAFKIADSIFEKGLFEDKLDIAKFAFAYAIRNRLDMNLKEIDIGDGRGISWNVGSFDGDRYLYNFIKTLYPENLTPYRLIENLMNAGLIEIGLKEQNEAIKNLSDLM